MVAASLEPKPDSFIKRILPRSLLGRSLLIIVTPLILLQIVLTWVFFARHWDTVTRRLAITLGGDVATIVQYLERHPAPADRRWIFDTALIQMGMRVSFLPDGRLAAAPDTTDRTPDSWLAKALAERLGQPFRIDSRTHENDVQVDVQMSDGLLQVMVQRKRLFSSTVYVVVLIMIGASLILIAVATVFMRNQVRPIRRLAAAAEAFGKGREAPDYKPQGAAEVRQAADAFLRMQERIRRQIRQRTEMLAGVSHDLRTPLTRMKLQLAMLDPQPEITELTADVAEMENMVEGYLAFARGEGTEKAQPTDISRLLEDVVTTARRNGGAIDIHTEGPMILSLRQEAMRRCLTNLVANAARYGDNVSIRAGRRGDSVEIFVDDDGPGVPDGEREEVFKPFYRIDRSRNPDTGGVGLGLTIAQDVMRSHGGDITLTESATGGLRVKLRLPT